MISSLCHRDDLFSVDAANSQRREEIISVV
jgi:hypothetical protein